MGGQGLEGYNWGRRVINSFSCITYSSVTAIMLFLYFLIYRSTFSHIVNKYSLRSNKLGTIVRAGSVVKNKIA